MMRNSIANRNHTAKWQARRSLDVAFGFIAPSQVEFGFASWRSRLYREVGGRWEGDAESLVRLTPKESAVRPMPALGVRDELLALANEEQIARGGMRPRTRPVRQVRPGEEHADSVRPHQRD
jgi:hypothetical protein